MNTGSGRGLHCNAYAGWNGDKVIAAQARSLGFTLVTDNTKGFCRYSGLVTGQLARTGRFGDTLTGGIQRKPLVAVRLNTVL